MARSPMVRYGAAAVTLCTLFVLVGSAVGAQVAAPGARAPGAVNYLLGNDPGRWRTGASLAGMAPQQGPGGLDFSTYLGTAAAGQTAANEGHAVAVDAQGYIYVAGSTYQFAFTTEKPLQPAIGGWKDAFVLKLTPRGDNLVFATFLGGNRDDSASGLVVDAAGSVHVVGYTESPDFPTARAAQARFGTIRDAFAAKLSPEGDRLLYSTYLGGTFQDVGVDVALDAAGNAYVAGSTNSYDFPTLAAVQPGIGGDSLADDAFVAKLDGRGALQFSTFFGGSLHDFGDDIAVDGAGNVFLAGGTDSDDLPVVRAIQPRRKSSKDWDMDAFLARLTPAGDALVFSTYLGGSAVDRAGGLALDGSGRVVLAGSTHSVDFPTNRPLQGRSKGDFDAFMVRLSPDGQVLDRATYLGGSATDHAYDVALASDGSVALLGYTISPDFPLASPLQARHGGEVDLFVAQLSPGMDTLRWSTYLGGGGIEPQMVGNGSSQVDGAAIQPALTLAPGGGVVLTAATTSQDFPTRNALYPAFPGEPTGHAAVAVRFGPLVQPTPTPAAPGGTACAFILGRVPPAAIHAALANPEGVRGWGELCNPGLPPSPVNILRQQLSIQNIGAPYNPLSNPLVFKCGCP